ncbi:hypothetical protein VULLAG_LOCUS12407 [Vulpes lagopus]
MAQAPMSLPCFHECCPLPITTGPVKAKEPLIILRKKSYQSNPGLSDVRDGGTLTTSYQGSTTPLGR